MKKKLSEEYVNFLSTQPESLVYFIEELMANWLDCMEQSNEN